MCLFRDRFSTHLKQNCHIGHNPVKIVVKSGTSIYFCSIMRRKLLLTSTITVAVIAILFGLICSLSSQTSLAIDHPDGPICTVPVSGPQLTVEVVPGLKFKIDTGSDVSTITTALPSSTRSVTRLPSRFTSRRAATGEATPASRQNATPCRFLSGNTPSWPTRSAH